MKKTIAAALIMTLILAVLALAGAEDTPQYQLGDKMEDFTATLLDGTEVTLYGLLSEKKAVMLNFWAIRCGPCGNEFPYMQEAYDEMSDDIAILAMNVEASDTAELISAYKESLGLDTLPLLSDNGVSKRFSYIGIPTSVLIDRNGVVCFIKSGSIPDKDIIKRLFSAYTGSDYDKPVLLSEIPVIMPTEDQPEEAIMRKALQITDERIAVMPLTDTAIWPFLPAADGSYTEAGNGRSAENKGTLAKLTLQVEAQAGDALAFERQTSFTAILSMLNVEVDGAVLATYGGRHDWTTDYVRFDTAGAHTVTFTYDYGIYDGDKRGAGLRSIRLVAADALPVLQAALPKTPGKPLAQDTLDIELVSGNVKPAVMETMTVSLETTPSYIAQEAENELTFRIVLGEDVNEKLAFLSVSEQDLVKNKAGEQLVMLNDLPFDERGYLYTYKLSEGFDPESTAVSLQAAARYTDGEAPVSYAIRRLFYTEAAINAETNMYNDLLQQRGGPEQFCTWRYADEEAPVAAAEGVKPGEYVIAVTNEAGEAVPGVMIQFCDDRTCMVLITDEAGKAVHIGADYPYEIHVLKAPEGYAQHAEVFTAKIGGDVITITLKAE